MKIRTHVFYFALLASLQLARGIESKVSQIPETKYECLNGKNPKKLTPKEILLEFSKSKCSPLIVIPALFSTRIVLEIDCETLRDENPEIFAICGWNSCTKKFYQFWKHVPKKEYAAWVPDFTSPLSILQVHEQKNYCWVKIASLAVDFAKPIESGIIEQKGFKVKVFGQTPGTAPESKCGDASNENLLNKTWIETKTTRYTQLFHQRLRDMGYVAGLTYQTLPYDFRLSYRANQLTTIFKPNLIRLHKLTGKKVVITGHSLGNVNVYHQLMNLTTNEKDTMVKSWVAVASAVGGSIDAMKALVGGDASYIFLKGYVGIHFHAEIEALHRLIAIYELLPYDPFTTQSDQPWLKALRSRMLYEQGKVKFEDSGFKFLPRLEDQCSPANFNGYPTECRLGIVDYSEEPLIQIVNDQYKIADIPKMLMDYPLTDETLNFYKYTRDPKMARFDNPGVPLVAINLRTGYGAAKYIYKTDVREYLKNHKFPFPEIVIGYGDGVIASTIQHSWPLKWAYEYDHNINGSKPVKLVDVCSTHNIKYDIYDSKDESKPYEFTDNEFSGVECECIRDKNTENCNHPDVFLDESVHKLLLNVLRSNEISYSNSYAKFVDSLNHSELHEMVTTCPQIIINQTPSKMTPESQFANATEI